MSITPRNLRGNCVCRYPPHWHEDGSRPVPYDDPGPAPKRHIFTDEQLAEHDRQVREEVATAIESVLAQASVQTMWVGGMREAAAIARTPPGDRWMLTEPCREPGRDDELFDGEFTDATSEG